ncbi:MAG: hypothetical protein DRJ03_27140 [Chloroflexi bacterium]|nr:MAG: hypothetical protein DRJ03_27140 [Chloroflexota bacterium]
MDGPFKFWGTTEIEGEESDFCLKGRYSASKGRKATRMEPAEEPEMDYSDLVLELGDGRDITDSSEIDDIVDWAEVDDFVGRKACEDERDAIDYAADLEMDLRREESF